MSLTTDAGNSRGTDEPIVTSGLSVEAERAEAEAREAEARALAARARARAIQLRLEPAATKATATSQSTAADGDAATTTTVEGRHESEAGQQAEATTESENTKSQRVVREKSARRIRWPRTWLAVTATVSTLLIIASGAATGVMWWQHRQAVDDRHHSLEFAGAARQGVTDLMSLNFGNAKDDVQRLINDTSGDFRKDLESHRDDFITAVQDSKVITTGLVKAVAVQSLSADSATVLVAASSKVANATGESQEQRTWRVTVTLTRVGGQLKMSKVEFMP